MSLRREDVDARLDASTVQGIYSALVGVSHFGSGGPDNYLTHVPWRADESKSLTINRHNGLWDDKGQPGEPGGTVYDAVIRVHDCTFVEALHKVAELLGIPKVSSPSTVSARGNAQHVIAEYNFTDESGNVLFREVKMGPVKRFYQQQPDGNGGWLNHLRGVRPVPYNLPTITGSPRSRPVYWVEGPKDSETVNGLGLLGTTNAGGAGNFKAELSKYFEGRPVVILPDNDKAGHGHAHKVAQSLHGIASSVKILHLPGLGPKGDVTDWVEAGGTRAQLQELATAAPEWTPHSEDLPGTCEPLPFPIDVLPDLPRAWVENCARVVGVPVDMVAPLMLAHAGAIAGNQVVLRMKRGWDVLPIVWVAIVAGVGEGKSPADAAVSSPMVAVFAEEKHRFDLALADWEQQEMDRQRQKGTPGNDAAPEQPKPTLRHIFSSGPTIEAIGAMLEYSSGLVVVRDELAGLITSMDQYRAKGGADRQRWLELHAGRFIKDDRKQHVNSTYVERPVVCLTGGLQPHKWKIIAQSADDDDGFIQRFAVVCPKTGPVLWTEDELDFNLQARMTDMYRHLWSTGQQVVTSSPEARELWREWHNDQAYARQDEAGLWRGFVAKSPTLCARLALILHVLTYPLGPCLQPLSADTLQNAIRLTDYFLAHARYALDQFGGNHDGVEALTPERVTILADLRTHGESRPTDVASRLGKSNSTVRTIMTKMAATGAIQRTRYGYYVIATVDAVDTVDTVDTSSVIAAQQPEAAHEIADSDVDCVKGATVLSPLQWQSEIEEAERELAEVAESIAAGTASADLIAWHVETAAWVEAARG